MEITVLNRFRRALTQRRDDLLTWLGREPDPRQEPPPGDHDGHAAQQDQPVLAHIDEALACIDGGAFGRCTLCEGSVEPERLALDFTTCVCLDHYSEAQLRDLERDLELAAQVQQHLFPRCLPALPGLQIAAHARPARIVGGDYYDFFGYPSGAQGIVLADVMGTGLPASMLMANLQASLRILGPEYDQMHALAGRLNELFRYNLKVMRFISMFLLTIDVDAGVLRYCNAGHNPPLWWQAASRSVRWLRPTGPAIGLMHAPAFTSETLRFASGDLLLLYTDGLVEARNGQGAAFGEERLAHYVGHHHGATAEAVLAGLLKAVARFAGGDIQDDVALLVVKVT